MYTQKHIKITYEVLFEVSINRETTSVDVRVVNKLQDIKAMEYYAVVKE